MKIRVYVALYVNFPEFLFFCVWFFRFFLGLRGCFSFSGSDKSGYFLVFNIKYFLFFFCNFMASLTVLIHCLFSWRERLSLIGRVYGINDGESDEQSCGSVCSNTI